ncbi:hypothetical protein AAVH_18734, partial [Aphelenchoides avenae]
GEKILKICGNYADGVRSTIKSLSGLLETAVVNLVPSGERVVKWIKKAKLVTAVVVCDAGLNGTGFSSAVTAQVTGIENQLKSGFQDMSKNFEAIKQKLDNMTSILLKIKKDQDDQNRINAIRESYHNYKQQLTAVVCSELEVRVFLFDFFALLSVPVSVADHGHVAVVARVR